MKKCTRLWVSIILCFVGFGAMAQPGDPGGGVDPDTVPISGIEILIALGGALGLKRIIDLRKTKK